MFVLISSSRRVLALFSVNSQTAYGITDATPSHNFIVFLNKRWSLHLNEAVMTGDTFRLGKIHTLILSIQ